MKWVKFILCLSLVVCSTDLLLYAGKKKIDQNPTELIKLGKNMADFGYYKSAQHYYKLAYRHPAVDKKTRSDLDIILLDLKKKIELQNTNKKALANLENLPHFTNKNNKVYKTTGITKKVESSSELNPKEFPPSRINKKKWIFTAIAIIGVALIVNKKIRDNNKDTSTPPSTPIQIIVN